MPWTEVYFLKRSTLAAFSCSSLVSTASGPSSSVIASTIDWRFSGDRDGAMVSSALSREDRTSSRFPGTCREPRSADEIPAVDDQDMAVDIVCGPAGQEDGGPHQVGGLTPAGSGDVIDDMSIGGRIGPGCLGDRCPEISRRDGIDLDVVGRQLVAVGLGEAHDSSFGRGIGRRSLAAKEGE